MKTLFLGDIHGCWGDLNDVLQRNKNTRIIQVGDLGLGFNQTYTYLNLNTGLWEAKIGKPDPTEFPKNFQFIRGNHDEPTTCRNHPNYLGDYGVSEDGIFFISGAWSIDHGNRTIGVDWWDEEELDYPDLQNAIELYEKIKPKIVVSHTAPSSICKILQGSHKKFYGSKTEHALETMWSIHKPKYWIFGHWHTVWSKNVLGTQFVCCAINGKFKLDLEKC